VDEEKEAKRRARFDEEEARRTRKEKEEQACRYPVCV
jgi:hypothetical protein